MIATIVDNETRGVVDPKPVFVLSIAALVFAVLMAQLVAMTTRLAGAWRLPQSAARDEASAAALSSTPAVSVASADPRIIAMVAAVSRDSDAPTFSARPRGDTVLLPQPAAYPENGEARRVSGAYRGFGAAGRRKESVA